MTKEDEVQFLNTQAADLQRALADVKQRLSELEREQGRNADD